VTGKETGAGDPRYELKLAMRSAVANDIAAFRDAHLHDGCALCGQTGLGAERMHVDHVTPFRDLAEAFFRSIPKGSRISTIPMTLKRRLAEPDVTLPMIRDTCTGVRRGSECASSYCIGRTSRRTPRL
jgi:ABC-type antimicrobial peptide transport system ATPase subunit